jgi:glycosyltransferase involved in cell wall biosynthesis
MSWDREAFGIVYLEALASNLAVVAPNDLARQEIVGQAGILIDPDNISQYANALAKALSRKWNNIPRTQAEKFSWQIVGDKYLKLIEKIINE